MHTVFGLRYAHVFMAIATNRAKVDMLAASFFQESGGRIISILPTFRSL